ncbi:hypothetical protein GCM10009092_38020 [Bowmanella denitrificans]|uniref:Lipoprotein n=1 Tax=Bowmanella denitrificans TaxID=366582 RepID=A0ABN0XR04_9ALTE
MPVRIALFALLLLLSACSKPLPEDKQMYAGEWQSQEMYLLILPDGTVAYKRLKNGGSTSVNGPLKEFNGNDFVVGIGPLSTTFEVSEPPHEVDGHWQMVVDGVRLTRSPD